MIYPIELHNRLIKTIGEYEVVNNYREGSKRTCVWKITSKSDSKNYFVKSYYRKSRWHPEVFAYKNWIPIIHPYAPYLIDSYEDSDLQAILVTELKGNTLREANNLSERQIENAYYKAGQLTQIIHSGFKGDFFGRPDCEGNPIEIFHHENPVYYYRQSILQSYNKGKKIGCFKSHEIDLAEWAVKNADVFENEYPRAVSWDSSPNNWIVNEEGEFQGFIDFENMLWGFDVDNFTILFERYFSNLPSGKEAFFRGYGYDILNEKSEKIKMACIKAGIGGIVWGLEFNDDRSVMLARIMLESL